MSRRKTCLGCGGGMRMALSEVSSDYCTGCASEFIDICHGYSPKFIQAAIEAVKEYDHNLDMQRFDVSWSTTAMFHAISLLPKGQPDA